MKALFFLVLLIGIPACSTSDPLMDVLISDPETETGVAVLEFRFDYWNRITTSYDLTLTNNSDYPLFIYNYAVRTMDLANKLIQYRTNFAWTREGEVVSHLEPGESISTKVHFRNRNHLWFVDGHNIHSLDDETIYSKTEARITQ